MTGKKEKLIIIDGNALLHRAFHAMPPLTTKDGQLVNAVYGFVTILMRVMKDMKPKYAAVTFDLKEPTFRHKKYKEYKATRQKQPDELYEQLPLIKQIVKAFQIPIYEMAGYEADDVIGTIAKKIEKKDQVETYIVTGDLDTLQLVDNNTFVYTLKKSIADTIVYDKKQVMEKYQGLVPEQLIDYKALRGDPSDNIPGVKGVGEKTAIELLLEFKNLENLYKKYKISKKIKPRLKDLLKEFKDDAFLSKNLATIVLDVPVKFKLQDSQFSGVNRQKIVDIFQKLEFKSLLGKIPELEAKLNLEKTSAAKTSQSAENTEYHLVENKTSLEKFLKKLEKQNIFAIDTETSDLDPWQADLLGISFSWQAGEAFYLDWLKLSKEKTLIIKLKKILSDDKVKKIGHNIKFDLCSLENAGLKMANIYFDTMIAAYLLHPGERRMKLDNLVFSEFGHQMTAIEELIGKKGKDQLSMADVSTKKISPYACEDADYTWQLYLKLLLQIKKAELLPLLLDIEMPLIPVLASMERYGIKINKDYLHKLNQQVSEKIADLEKKIHHQAGEEFNIASPKQLKEILFDKLNIPTEGLKKIKTGFSTAAGELEKMRELHPIVDMISQYRELTKLQSTYIEALPKLINKETKRVHTSYNQTITATGRLSSSDPNLQNIPIRTSLGKKIRGAIVAEKNSVLIAADYSQIELRIVAHLAGDEVMINTFQEHQDIHTATAAFIFDVSLQDVDQDMRRKAKEVNFGVLYGMGAYGLSQRTGISRFEAKKFIDRYFNKYKKVKKYTEETVLSARKKEKVKTLFGRTRFLPEINSSIAMVRKAAERAAINLPVQGTSADIMKLAMINVYQAVSKEYPQAKMIMQVHDEMVLEVPKNEIKNIAQLIKKEMESVAQLKVPLEVEIKQGINWLEMENIVF